MNASLSHHRRLQPLRWIGTAALATSLFLTACGPSDVGKAKLSPLKPGATRAEVLAAIGTGPIAPTGPQDQPRIVSGFRRQLFITNGGRSYEILWYREEPGTVADSILRERETPIVLLADTLDGWGWKFFNEYSKKTNLPNPTMGKARLDSIYKAQNPDSIKNRNN